MVFVDFITVVVDEHWQLLMDCCCHPVYFWVVMIVVPNECGNVRFEITGQEVVF